MTATTAAASLLLAGATEPAVAAWQPSAVAAAPLSTAQLGSSFVPVAGAGSVTPNGAEFSVANLLLGATGFVDLVNTSTVPARISLTATMGTLVGVAPTEVCSVPWNTATRTCPGTTSLVGMALLLGTPTGTHTSATVLPPGGRTHLKISLSGVAGGITLRTGPVIARAAAERTAA